MSLFAWHVADKQQFPAFLCRQGGHCHAWSLFGIFHVISVKAFRLRIWEKNSFGPRDPKRINRADEAYGQGNGRQSFCTLKTLDTGIWLLSVFKLELKMDYPSETSLCTLAPSDRHPFFNFFWGEGAAVYRLSEKNNPSSNCPSKLTDKVRGIVHSKLKRNPFHFKLRRITYLTRIITRITHLTRIIRL